MSIIVFKTQFSIEIVVDSQVVGGIRKTEIPHTLHPISPDGHILNIYSKYHNEVTSINIIHSSYFLHFFDKTTSICARCAVCPSNMIRDYVVLYSSHPK